ncbi:MAG: NADH-quinone oxidoreductase subunit C [Deltaproteobacteria bacterium]|nr:NADH-quinone oxidoreductase subunit C [Deltaproteobacteria bacterium]
MSVKVIEKIKEKFPAAVIESHSQCGDDTVVVRREFLVEIAKFLKDDPECDFRMPLDVTCVDYLKMNRAPRFEVVYHLRSLSLKQRIRIKVPVEESDAVVPSLYKIWRGVDWFERETYDMFGIKFSGHPNLKRILLYEEFNGHPLRKDYPQRGYQPLLNMPKLRGDKV